MKKTITLLSFLVITIGFLTLTSCMNGFNCIKGSKDITKQERPAGEFAKIKALGSADIFVTQGDQFSIIVEADNNIISNITTKISDNTLTISSEGNICPSKLNVYVTLPVIEALTMVGSGDFVLDKPVNFKNLLIDIRGSGDANCNYLNGEVFAISISGSGNVDASGKTVKQDISLSGSGDIDLHKLAAEECNAKISGSGNIKVNVIKTLNAKVSGSGDIRYWGAPSVNSNVSGSGSVKKAD